MTSGKNLLKAIGRASVFSALPALSICCAAALAIAAGPAAASRQSDAAAKAIEEVKSEHAIDPRTVIFEVKAEEGPRESVILTGITSEEDLFSALMTKLVQQGIRVDGRIEIAPNREALKHQIWATVKVPRAQLLEYMDDGSPVAAEAVMGTPMQVLQAGPTGKLRVRLPDGRIAWAKPGDVHRQSDTTLLIWNRREKLVVTSTTARLWPSREAAQAAKTSGAQPPADAPRLPAGSRLIIDSKDADGFSILTPDAKRGWVSAEDAEKLYDFQVREENARREDPVRFLNSVSGTAAMLAGTPARAGGATSFEADGAGLAAAAFFLHDLILPQEADRQAYLGAPLSGGKGWRELKAGDLLFFGTPGAGKVKPRVKAEAVSLGKSSFLWADAEGASGEKTVKKGALAAGAIPGLGAFLWAVRLHPDELANPCMLSTRSHPYFQTPPAPMQPCRLRAH